MQVAIENEEVLSSYVSHARAGEDVVLTENGQEVARIVPVDGDDPLPKPLLQGKEREEAIERLKRLLTAGIPLGGVAPTKDQMHERD